MNRNFAICLLVFALGIYGCSQKHPDSYIYHSGNAIKDYFYRKGYEYPFYCDSLKPICKKEALTRALGKYEKHKLFLASQACSIIKRMYKTDSLLQTNNFGFTVFPVFVYFIDSPVVWYRVIYREYTLNSGHMNNEENYWQAIDSNRLLASYHNLEFQVNDIDSLEFKCDKM